MFRALTVVPSTLNRRYLNKSGEQPVEDGGPGEILEGENHCDSPLRVRRRPPEARERQREQQQALEVGDTSGREKK